MWLSQGWRSISGAFAARDFGPYTFEITERSLPYGANYAIRREVQLLQMYDNERGRKGGQLLSGEETHVLSTLLAGGHRGRWLPNAPVNHIIDEDRQTLRYIRDYFHSYGVLERRLENGNSGIPPRFGRHIRGVPLWLIRKALVAEAAYQFGYFTRAPSEWLEQLAAASTYWGMVEEAFQTGRSQSAVKANSSEGP